MGTHVAVVIDWFGPFKGIQEANEAAEENLTEGLYLFIGKAKHQKSPPKILYVGVSEFLPGRLTPQHHKLPNISGDPLIWLGGIASYGIPGRVSHNLIHHAESAIVYFIQPPLNDRKASFPPDFPITVFNRWWRKNYKTPRKQRPHRAWPDIIEFTGWDYGARVGWVNYSDRYDPEDFYINFK